MLPSLPLVLPSREMEQHYGTHFFDRINQRLRITEEGKALL